MVCCTRGTLWTCARILELQDRSLLTQIIDSSQLCVGQRWCKHPVGESLQVSKRHGDDDEVEPVGK